MRLAVFTARIAGEEQNSVNLRDIHEKVESKQEFANWAKSRLAACGAVEGRDYTVDKFINGRQVIDYHVTLDIAKHCAMLERNERGFAVRQYLIDVEKTGRGNAPVVFTQGAVKEILASVGIANSTANQALATADRAEKKADKALKLVVINKNPAPTTRQDNIKLWREAGKQASSTMSKHKAKYGVDLEDYGWSVDALRIDLIAKFNAGIDRWNRRVTSIKDLSLDQMDPNGGFDYRSNHEWVHRTSNSSKQDKTLSEYSQLQHQDEPELPF